MKQIALATLRWILLLPCALAVSILIPWLNLLLCGVLPGAFYWPFSFMAAVLSGSAFVWAAKMMAPSGKRIVGLVFMLATELMVVAAVIAVFCGFQFELYPRWWGIICTLGTGWGALTAAFSGEAD